MRFAFSALVAREVMDTISIDVEADTEEQAIEVVKKVLRSFPDRHSEEGVSYCYVENRDNGYGEVLEIAKRA